MTENPESDAWFEAGGPLAVLRRRLDDLDGQLVTAMAARLAVCDDIGYLKRALGLPMMQPQRVHDVTERYARGLLEHGVRGEFGRKLATLIIEEACSRELEIIAAENS